jgi:hypothetical protein
VVSTLATDAPPARAPRRHVAGALGLLAAVLVALIPLLGGDALFSADEGAAVAQARLLQEERGWVLPHPLPELDPSGRTFPLENASLVTGPDGAPGGAPFAKHPAYAVLLAPFDRAAGLLGMTFTSVLGTVLAAGVAGLLTWRLAPSLAPIAVLATGLATPLFVDSWLVIAHTLGAALVGAAVLSVLRADERRSGAPLLGAVAAMAGAVLLRNEALLFGVALGLTAVLLGWRARRRPLVWGGLAAFGGAVAGYLLDGVLSAAVAGDAEASFRAGVSGSGFLAGRVLGAVVTLVLPSYGGLGVPDLLLVVCLGALLGLVAVIRLRPQDEEGIQLLAAVAALAAVARAVIAPEVVPGLLVAAPVLTAGLAALRGRQLQDTTSRLLAGTAALYVGAVLATQYSTGGSGEWGGRYFALVLPVVVPLALVAGRDLLGRLRPAVGRRVLAAVAAVALALAVAGGRALVTTEARTDELVAAVEDAASQLDDPVVVATAGAAPRFAWTDVLDGGDWLLVELEDTADWLDRLDAAGRDVVLATPDLDEVPRLETGYEAVGEHPVGHGSAWTAVALSTG